MEIMGLAGSAPRAETLAVARGHGGVRGGHSLILTKSASARLYLLLGFSGIGAVHGAESVFLMGSFW